MKGNLIILIVAVGVLACEKNNISSNSKPSPVPNVTAIIGKWIVAQDSIMEGPSGINRMKTDSDYYEFYGNGLLLIKEGARVDTAVYSLSNEPNIQITFKEKVILNRFSGDYLINGFSSSLFSLSWSGTLNAPVTQEGLSTKVKVAIVLHR